METGRSFEVLFDLAIVGPDELVINDDKEETLLEYRKNVCIILHRIIKIMNDCLPDIKDENIQQFIKRRIKSLMDIVEKILNFDMNLFFEEARQNNRFDFYYVIKEFMYSEIADNFARLHRFYYSASAKNRPDKYILSYIFNAYKKAMYDLGIRSCDIKTLIDSFMCNNEEATHQAPIDSENVYSDDSFNSCFDNATGIQIMSIPYYVVLSTKTFNGMETRRFKLIGGDVVYSQSMYNKITNKEQKNR